MIEPQERVVALDGVRTLAVLFVVILHAACAYSEIIPWWSVQEFPKEVPYTLVILFFDLFCMPVLFFVAGHFALPSLQRRGARRFLAAKLRRLGIPFALLAVFYTPTISYLGYLGRTADPMDFFHFWAMQLSGAWKPVYFLYDSVESSVAHMNDFSQWHLWFIPLLLIFFGLTALAARIVPRLLRPSGKQASGLRIMAQMLIGGGAAIVITGWSYMQVQHWAWATVGGYLMFQPTRLGLYFAFFALGIAAQRAGWFRQGGIPGPAWAWLAAGLVLDVAFLAMGDRVAQYPGPAPASLAFAHATVRCLAGLAWLAVMTKTARRWWTPRPVFASLDRSAYDIYLLHLPVIVGLQWAATLLPVGFALKVVLESVLCILLCWQLSFRVVRPRPLAVLALLGAWFLAACLWL